ncbi:MAG: hypothetical protein K2K21_09660 [Lachnospiraceae bacterium]|nr:hypothetical protein [Lachnospiraceae bacterium]
MENQEYVDAKYIELLKQYYSKYGDEMFISSKIIEFKSACASQNIDTRSYDIAEDLRNIRKIIKGTMPEDTPLKPTQRKQIAVSKPKQTTTQDNYTLPKKTTTNTYYTPPKPQTTTTPQNYNKALGILGREAGKSLGNVLLSIANEVMKSL